MKPNLSLRLHLFSPGRGWRAPWAGLRLAVAPAGRCPLAPAARTARASAVPAPSAPRPATPAARA